MAVSPEAPTRERGQAMAVAVAGVMPWTQFMDEREHVPEMMWLLQQVLNFLVPECLRGC